MQLKQALEQALQKLGDDPEVLAGVQAIVQAVPEGKAGDYGSPLAFGLAKKLQQNPVVVANSLLEKLELPSGIARA
ncbi:hypothetical protein, partial [Escherichia coli]|uniref:hypothetical protein n=1 Tax=Escherichia coli TaxID=562 RepID=UPI001F4B8EA8